MSDDDDGGGGGGGGRDNVCITMYACATENASQLVVLDSRALGEFDFHAQSFSVRVLSENGKCVHFAFHVHTLGQAQHEK